MYGYIYLTTNILTNKIYIGQKKSDIFLGESYLGSGKYLKRAVAKYGEENFKVKLIDTAESRKELSDKEIFYINKFDATNNDVGYNIAKGGIGGGEVHINNGIINRFVSKEHLEDYLNNGWALGFLPGRKEVNHSATRATSISNSLKGKSKTREHARKHNESMKSKHRHWYTDGTIDGNIQIPEGEEIPSGFFRGRTITEEQRIKCGSVNVGRTAWNKGLTKETDERVAKYSNTLKETLNKTK